MPSWIDASKTGFKLSVLVTVKVLDAISDLHGRRNQTRPIVSNTELTRAQGKTEPISLIKSLIR